MSSFFNCEEVNLCDVGAEDIRATIGPESLYYLKRIICNRVNESLFNEINKKRQYIPSVRKTKKWLVCNKHNSNRLHTSKKTKQLQHILDRQLESIHIVHRRKLRIIVARPTGSPQEYH